jgi:nicotinamidase/pyrazinamidase
MERGMTRLVFWDVDTLYDFMRSDGKLYVPGSEEIIPALEALTAFAHAHRIPIVASADNHDSGDAEISEAPDWKTTFPPHCMRGTAGQRKIAQTALVDPLVIEPEPEDAEALGRRIQAHRGDFLLNKHTLDVFSNANVSTLLVTLAPKAIVVYGVATDFCDRYTIEGLLRDSPGTELFLVTDAIRAIYPEEGARLLAQWEQLGVRLVTSAEVRTGRILAGTLPADV